MKNNKYKKKCSKCGRYKHIDQFAKRNVYVKKVYKDTRYICGKCGHMIHVESRESECKGCKNRINKVYRSVHANQTNN